MSRPRALMLLIVGPVAGLPASGRRLECRTSQLVEPPACALGVGAGSFTPTGIGGANEGAGVAVVPEPLPQPASNPAISRPVTTGPDRRPNLRITGTPRFVAGSRPRPRPAAG